VATPIFNSNLALVFGTAVELKQFSLFISSLLLDSCSFALIRGLSTFLRPCREADLRAERLASGATKTCVEQASQALGAKRQQ
jgi:hypothetical protein